MYRIEVTGQDSDSVRVFDTAEEAMQGVNMLRAERCKQFTIQDATGAVLSVGQLAAIAIAQQWAGKAT